MPSHFRRPLPSLASALALSLSMLLSACGGGGGGSPAAPPPAPPVVAPVTPPVPAATLRLHYSRPQNDTAAWGVYAWEGPLKPSVTWIVDRFMFDKTDAFGAYADIALDPKASAVKFLVTDGSGNKNCASDQTITLAANIATTGQEAWMAPADCTLYASPPVISAARLSDAGAHWLAANTLAWPGASASGSYKLYYAANAGMRGAANGIDGADGSYPLAIDGTLPAPLQARFPHLKTALSLSLSAADAASAKARLKGQLVLAQFDAAGKMVQAQSVQTAGVLDDLYAAAAAGAALGPTFSSAGVPTLRVWAPTAKSVKLNLYGAASTSVDMSEDGASGVWSYTAPDASLVNAAYYTFSVTVFSRAAGNQVVSSEVTDPYSVSTNANGKRSFLANLASAATKPAGWDGHPIPALAHAADISIYELHVRDFSASDATVPAARKGKYLAFTDPASNGMRHLKLLQQAGLTHIHLLPTADMASISETGCTSPAIPAAGADSELQQAAVAATRDSDCFNWGYDPLHYNVPEGAYASDAGDGLVRIREYRAMIKSLHESGLRVAMDVVYNHTSAAGQDDKSVLDKIVPGYYYRTSTNAGGAIVNDSCCADTAPENAMMAKLVVDSLTLWSTAYQVDSFRFDIMGMLPLPLLTRAQAELKAATGREIYLYGEGWNFGAVANDTRFVQARQANMAGTGIGTFNDRLRDAVRGGGCCDNGEAAISQQGFINGAFYDRNARSTQTLDDLLRMADLVKVALAGSLKDYRLTDRFGAERAGSEVDYFGLGAGYVGAPQETINYVEAHDNQTLFDINAFKLPQATVIDDRVRVQNLGNAITILSQGIPFLHAGQELLRSKSLDRDSYNAGDWFNALDFSYQSNNFGVGLPPAEKNQENWALMRPILADPAIKPGNSQILATRNSVLDLLAMRAGSTLFRLRTANDIKQRLRFFNNGPAQVPGVIALRIDGQLPTVYPGAVYKSVVVLFNADKVARTLVIPELKGLTLAQHPVQRASLADGVAKTASYTSASGEFGIPARTTVVFVE